MLCLCVNSQPLLSSSSSNEQSLISMTSNPCTEKIGHCSFSSLDRMSCPEIKELKQCLDNLKQICHGSIHYHSFSSLVDRKSTEHCRVKNNNHRNRHRQRNKLQHHQLSSSSTQRPPIRSMFPESSWHQQLSTSNEAMVKSGPVHHRKNPISLESLVNIPSSPVIATQVKFNNNKSNKPEYFQYCLQAAYNYTIGMNILPNKKNLVEHRPFLRHQRYKRQNDRVADIMYHHLQPQRERQQRPQMNDLNSRLNETTAQLASELIFKPVHPMTPSLTCIIFGDPHLRTFDSQYQTCNCLGARSMLEHPLFDVQITNTRILGKF